MSFAQPSSFQPINVQSQGGGKYKFTCPGAARDGLSLSGTSVFLFTLFTCEMNDGVWIAELGALGWGTGFKRCTGDAANRRANAASDAYVRQIRPNKARERWA